MSDRPIRPEEGAHWYQQDGTPRWEATLKDARLEDLVPGQSTFTHQMAKPGLEIWKLNQLLLAALTLPQKKGETLEAYAERVAEDYRQESERARDTGHVIHEMIESAMEQIREDGAGALHPLPAGPVTDLVRPVDNWIGENVATGASEDIHVSLDYGYAGTVDFCGYLQDDVGLLTIIDWKSQNVKRSYKRGPKNPNIETIPGQVKGKDILPAFTFYPEHSLQLSAYRQAVLETLRSQTKALDMTTLGDSVPQYRYVGPWRPEMEIRCMSGMISTNAEIPGMAIRLWTDDEMDDAFGAFLSLVHLWRWNNRFPYNRKGDV